MSCRGFREQISPRSKRTSAAIVQWNAEDAIANAGFAQHRYIFNQFSGLHVMSVQFLASSHPIRNERDVENYLARLACIAPCLDKGIAEARDAAAAGIVPPRFILERTIEQLDGLTTGAPAEHVLVAGLARRMAALDDFPESRARVLLAAAEAEVRDRVVPALERVRAMLVDQTPGASDVAGVWRLPNGAAFYARELASATRSSLSPQEIHALGLREVARIEREMDGILKELGYPDGTIQSRVSRLNETLQLPTDPDPRDGVVAELNAVVQDAERRSEAAFDLRPESPVTVRREPAFSEKSAAAHYTPPAPDGSQPGVYWVPLADLSSNVAWLGIGLKSTAYHEAIPGHHFQLAIQQESAELPRFRKLGAFGYDPAFAEGWALYSEQLADENGWYANDLPGRLGYLQMQLFRARRLVVDTGLHQMQWTRERAIDYGFTAAEIERYIVWPGQACSYMIGRLRIVELRERARKALGARFDIKRLSQSRPCRCDDAPRRPRRRSRRLGEALENLVSFGTLLRVHVVDRFVPEHRDERVVADLVLAGMQFGRAALDVGIRLERVHWPGIVDDERMTLIVIPDDDHDVLRLEIRVREPVRRDARDDRALAGSERGRGFVEGQRAILPISVQIRRLQVQVRPREVTVPPQQYGHVLESAGRDGAVVTVRSAGGISGEREGDNATLIVARVERGHAVVLQDHRRRGRPAPFGRVLRQRLDRQDGPCSRCGLHQRAKGEPHRHNGYAKSIHGISPEVDEPPFYREPAISGPRS